MLDADHWSAEEVACALGAIRRVNLLYGGNRMHKRMFRRVASQIATKDLHVLEVASGHADVLQAAGKMLQQDGYRLQISLLDRCSLHLPGPADWDQQLPAPECMAGDALQIPFPDNSVDVVSCCLFLHHLSVSDARAFLQEALRVAKYAVIVNDVERTRRNYALSHLYRLMDPSWLSRHDGPTSVRQAYTFGELEQMLRETGYRFELHQGFLFRLGAVLWKECRSTTG